MELEHEHTLLWKGRRCVSRSNVWTGALDVDLVPGAPPGIGSASLFTPLCSLSLHPHVQASTYTNYWLDASELRGRFNVWATGGCRL